MNTTHLPTFVLAADGKWYEDLIYQDDPRRRAWFLCFSDREPAEFVVRVSELSLGVGARDILLKRGFGPSMRALINGRKDAHQRFFGEEEGKPIYGYDAVTFFLVFNKGIPLPTPCKFDSCVETYSFFPNKEGVYFGEKAR